MVPLLDSQDGGTSSASWRAEPHQLKPWRTEKQKHGRQWQKLLKIFENIFILNKKSQLDHIQNNFTLSHTRPWPCSQKGHLDSVSSPHPPGPLPSHWAWAEAKTAGRKHKLKIDNVTPWNNTESVCTFTPGGSFISSEHWEFKRTVAVHVNLVTSRLERGE